MTILDSYAASVEQDSHQKRWLSLATAVSVVFCMTYPLSAENAPASAPADETAQQEVKQPEVKSSKKPVKEIIVTETGSDDTEGKKIYYVVINDLLKISDIEVSKIAGKTIVKYPVYVSKRSGRAYPQVKVVSKQANDAITKAVETGKATKPAGLSPDMDFRISVFNPSRSASRKVNVEVTFTEAISVSCGVMETGAEPWIAWPSRKDDQTGQYLQQIFFKGTLKKKVDDAILKKYQTYKTEGDTGEWK